VLTIGGGTPIDTVKMALLCLAEGLEEPDELDRFAISVREDGSRHSPEVRSPPLRQIVAPTTLSGAEFSDLAGCIDLQSQRKHLFTGADLGAASVILDPSITLHTPKDLWLSTGVRAIDHAIEALCSTVPEPVADAGALQALRLLSQSLPQNARAESELDARLDSQIGVWLACAGLNRVPYGASHGIGHQLGAVAGVPHGFTSCVMLPHVLAYNEPSTESTQRLIAEALGKPEQSASAAVADLIKSLGMPTRLRDVGVERKHFSAIASGSLLNPWVRANPRRIDSEEQILEILEQAY
jgi:alcohol dehydrogenase class IV